MATIKIGFRDALAHYAKMAKEFALSPIPDRQRLPMVIDRLSREVDVKRAAWQDALRMVIQIQNPDEPNDGRLPRARARLASLEAQGKQWGVEHNAPVTTAERKERLKQNLDVCEVECTKIEQEVPALEKQLTMRQDTARIREAAYKKAKSDLHKLQTIASTLIEQTDALQDAQRERMAALKSAADRGEDTGVILKDLQAAFDEAQAGHAAAIEIEEEEAGPDIDAIIAAEHGADTRSARMDRWLGASAS